MLSGTRVPGDSVNRLSSITAQLLFSPLLGRSLMTHVMFDSCCHSGVTEALSPVHKQH